MSLKKSTAFSLVLSVCAIKLLAVAYIFKVALFLFGFFPFFFFFGLLVYMFYCCSDRNDTAIGNKTTQICVPSHTRFICQRN